MADDAAGGYQQCWLYGEAVSLHGMGAERGFAPEVCRVIELLDADQAWQEWWRRIIRRRYLELQILLLRPPSNEISAAALTYAGADETVRRRPHRCFVLMHVDSDELGRLEPDERRLRALPVVLDGISRAAAFLRATDPPPAPPSADEPAPLSPAVLRRKRLRELLDAQKHG